MRMDKVEKVKKGLECCAEFDPCNGCPYIKSCSENMMFNDLAKDALEIIGTMEHTIQEKDAQIASLRAQLDEAMLWR